VNGASDSPFDDLAAKYDEDFTGTLVGRLMRDAVWRRLDAVFPPGGRILDLGCGTGEDAIHLARRGHDVHAVDGSEAMVRLTREKVHDAALKPRVRVSQLDIEHLEGLGTDVYDGVLSNFGALNCVQNLSSVSTELAGRTVRGASVVLCLMGPTVPWEWVWYLARANPSKAFRRLRSGGVAWRGIQIRYPSIAQVRATFASDFEAMRVAALGALVPPAYAEPILPWLRTFIESLARLERVLETVPPLPWLADHYLLELRRR